MTDPMFMLAESRLIAQLQVEIRRLQTTQQKLEAACQRKDKLLELAVKRDQTSWGLSPTEEYDLFWEVGKR